MWKCLLILLIESLPAFVMRADISHLVCPSQILAFVHVYCKDRKMQLRLATPPYNILGSSGNFPYKDAFPWSLWSLVTWRQMFGSDTLQDTCRCLLFKNPIIRESGFILKQKTKRINIQGMLSSFFMSGIRLSRIKSPQRTSLWCFTSSSDAGSYKWDCDKFWPLARY